METQKHGDFQRVYWIINIPVTPCLCGKRFFGSSHTADIVLEGGHVKTDTR